MREWKRVYRAVALLSVIGAGIAPCAAGPAASRPAEPLPEYSIRAADDIVFEIDPRLELLSAAQAMTSWAEGPRGPGDSPSRYFRDLKAFIEPYAGSRAVRLSQAMTNRGFTYDAPPAFALSLEGGSAMAPPADGWSGYLRKRAGGARALDRFAAALGELYDDSGFGGFLAAHADDYARWLGEARTGFDADRISAWLEAFYGEPDVPTVYHFAFAPAMFPGGGYGFSRRTGTSGAETLHIYQVVRAGGYSDGPSSSGGADEPGFPSGRSLALLGLHEFGHSFVNPALEAAWPSPGGADGLEAIFKPVKSVMERQAYPQASIFYNELVIRAVCVVAGRELGLLSDYEARAELAAEAGKGFYPIGRVVDLIAEYQASRERYPRFGDFAPALLERLAADASAIVEEGAAGGYRAVYDASLLPSEGFAEGFEVGTGPGGLPAGFSVSVGSSIGSGPTSELGRDGSTAASGNASFSLSADSDTRVWLYLGKPVAVRPGTLTLSYSARGDGIVKEAGQYGNSYVGFVVTLMDGSVAFPRRTHAGGFPWSSFEVEYDVVPSRVRSIEFICFLNESGRLWIDDIAVAYR